jgi:hypothetical protein
MSTERLRREVRRLRQDLGVWLQPGEPCPRMFIGRLVVQDVGEPEPEIAEDTVESCPTCGERHLVIEQLVIVEGDDS